MKVIFAFILIILATSIKAEVEIAFRPERPVINESFEMDVTIAFEGNEEPFISFDPGGLTVEGRRKGGVSFTTQLINGQFTSQKTMSFIYQLRSNRTGTFYLRDFTVRVGSSSTKKDNIRIQVLREAEKPKDYFLEAIPSKENVYKGEGFFVNYYLYTRVSIYNKELKEYPKLNGFLKRFKNVDETPERVERGGLMYQRSKQYSARLFAEKTGKLTIDGLKLQVAVAFGGSSGFGLRDMRNAILTSAPVEILVTEPPLENMASGFTGLIGNHTFNLSMRKTKYLVNEPIEVKLEIIGPGLLEKMDTPVIFSHPDLETFDTRTEVQEMGPDKSRKVLEYTYLPRGEMNLAEKTLELAVFDAEKKEYITTELKIPSLVVIGGGSAAIPPANNPIQNSETVASKAQASSSLTLDPVSPFGKHDIYSLYQSPIKIILWLFSFLFLIAVLSNINFKSTSSHNEIWTYYKKHMAKGLDYKTFHHFMAQVYDGAETDLDKVFDREGIPADVKNYFLSLIGELRKNTYATDSSPRKLRPKKKMFKKFVKCIQ